MGQKTPIIRVVLIGLIEYGAIGLKDPAISIYLRARVSASTKTSLDNVDLRVVHPCFGKAHDFLDPKYRFTRQLKCPVYVCGLYPTGVKIHDLTGNLS